MNFRKVLKKVVSILIILCFIQIVILLHWNKHLRRKPTAGVDCKALFRGDKRAQNMTLRLMATSQPTKMPDIDFSTVQCSDFISRRNYFLRPTAEEKAFPIAFSLVVYKDVWQVERLFRAIYRPQNAYCFHVDRNSSSAFKAGMERLVSCFPNVILASRSVSVVWGRWPVLEADLICMKDLLRRFRHWKYLINLTGQEFPLRTNLELVRILKTLNGSNSMEGTVEGLPKQRIPKGNPGFKVTWTKGQVHIVAKRAFFEFAFTNPKALKLMEMLKPAIVPDETFFSTLNHNPSLGTPGAFLGKPGYRAGYWYIPRVKNWGNAPCRSGKFVREICIWGVLDLPYLNTQMSLFINKLFWDFQPYTLACLEERIFNHSLRDYGDASHTSDPVLDLTPYRTHEIVRNHQ